jgi:hypothetical protein
MTLFFHESAPLGYCGHFYLRDIIHINVFGHLAIIIVIVCIVTTNESFKCAYKSQITNDSFDSLG